MKAMRISTALSLLILSATAHPALAVGDPNLDSGVGTASSRGPYGFNNTDNGNIYKPMPNDYGVWRDAYGGLRDRGNIPDNLITRVPEPTWEETHPEGPPKIMGAPGGLAGGLGGFGGFGGFGMGGFGLGSSFAFPGFLSAFGGGNAAINAAVAAANNHPIPIGQSNLGAFGGAPRTNYGYAGAPLGVNEAPFTGQRYMGPWSGFINNPTATTTSTVVNGTQRTVTNWQTSMGPAQLVETTTPTGRTTDEFQFNGNSYNTVTQIQPNTAPGTTTFSNNSTTALGAASAALANQGVFGGASGNVPANSRVSTTYNSNNGWASPFEPNGYGQFVDPNAAFHGMSTTIGGNMVPTPREVGGAQGMNFVNDQATGMFGADITPQREAGNYRSPLFGSSIGIGTIGGETVPSNQNSGTQISATIPSPNNSNFGLGSGLGGYPSLGGSPGFPSVGFSAQGPFNGFSPLLGLGGGYGSYGGAGFAGFGGMTGYGGAGGGYAGSPYMGSSGYSNGSGNGTAGSATNGSSSNGESYDDDKSNGAIARVAGAATFMGSRVEPGPSLRQSNPTGFAGPLPTFAPKGPRVGSMGERAAAPLPNVPGIDTKLPELNMQPSGAAPGAGNGGRAGARRRQPAANRTGGATLSRTGGDGAYGFFGGSAAIASGINAGLSYGMPYLGGAPQPPLAWYGAGRVVRDTIANQSAAAGGEVLLGSTVEGRLALRRYSPAQALGRVIGSMRFDNGDIITYGTQGTLRVSADNSGSITYNNGEVETFVRVPEAFRRIAYTSTVIF